MPLIRFGVSLEKDLLKQFDSLISQQKYTCRSEAIRDLIREDLVRKQFRTNKKIAGAITLVYDHHKRSLVNQLTNIQHDFGHLILASQHMHLDHDNCLEIIAVHGSAKLIQKLSDSLKSVKGVKHGTLSLTTKGNEF